MITIATVTWFNICIFVGNLALFLITAKSHKQITAMLIRAADMDDRILGELKRGLGK